MDKIADGKIVTGGETVEAFLVKYLKCKRKRIMPSISFFFFVPSIPFMIIYIYDINGFFIIVFACHFFFVLFLLLFDEIQILVIGVVVVHLKSL